MRKPKYRVDTYPVAYLAERQLLLEDYLDEHAEQGWHFVTAFVIADLIWVISKRSWWWRVNG